MKWASIPIALALMLFAVTAGAETAGISYKPLEPQNLPLMRIAAADTIAWSGVADEEILMSATWSDVRLLDRAYMLIDRISATTANDSAVVFIEYLITPPFSDNDDEWVELPDVFQSAGASGTVSNSAGVIDIDSGGASNVHLEFPGGATIVAWPLDASLAGYIGVPCYGLRLRADINEAAGADGSTMIELWALFQQE